MIAWENCRPSDGTICVYKKHRCQSSISRTCPTQKLRALFASSLVMRSCAVLYCSSSSIFLWLLRWRWWSRSISNWFQTNKPFINALFWRIFSFSPSLLNGKKKKMRLRLIKPICIESSFLSQIGLKTVHEIYAAIY